MFDFDKETQELLKEQVLEIMNEEKIQRHIIDQVRITEEKRKGKEY